MENKGNLAANHQRERDDLGNLRTRLPVTDAQVAELDACPESCPPR